METYVKEYLTKEKAEISMQQAARTASSFYILAQPQTKTMHIYNSILVDVTNGIQTIIRSHEPYVKSTHTFNNEERYGRAEIEQRGCKFSLFLELVEPPDH